MLLKEERKTLV